MMPDRSPYVLDVISPPEPAPPADVSAAARASRAEFPVALVAMPFVTILRPSIQLGLLKAIAAAHGFPATALHLYLDFAKQVDTVAYEAIAESGRSFMGDWLFAAEAFGPEPPAAAEAFLEEYASKGRLYSTGQIKPDDLLAIRRVEVPRYLDGLMAGIAWDRFRVVGFTSTFQQNVASIALATRLKRAYPSLTVIFGGSNCEGDMGVEFARSFPCADYVFVGEADRAFPEFLAAAHEGRDPAGVAGVVCRRDGGVTEPASGPPFDRLDELPTPDYDEFFERAEALDLLPPGPRRVVRLPFESARGCWWGAKHHCTFCGLNGRTMTFRAKSPGRVLDELRALAGRYRSFMFTAVDNIIDVAYLDTVCVDLLRERTDYDIFYEVKSNLSREQFKRLRDAGVRQIQPGIESLNTRILKLMDKGVTGITNVNTLRWGRYYGMAVGWNLLYGFPGEQPEDYAAQASLLRRLAFLEPPNGAGRIWMERFSPVFRDRARFPVKVLEPAKVYRHIYPAGVDLERLAYFFDYEFEDSLPEATYDETVGIVTAWRKAWEAPQKPRLTFWSARDFLQIEDTRDPAAPGTYTFEGPLASLYTALGDRPRAAAKVREELKLACPVGEVEDALDEFCANGLMMREGNLFLALALPATPDR
jgi:ribosomal peptide maturation radical SAM protein 1